MNAASLLMGSSRKIFLLLLVSQAGNATCLIYCQQGIENRFRLPNSVFRPPSFALRLAVISLQLQERSF